MSETYTEQIMFICRNRDGPTQTDAKMELSSICPFSYANIVKQKREILLQPAVLLLSHAHLLRNSRNNANQTQVIISSNTVWGNASPAIIWRYRLMMEGNVRVLKSTQREMMGHGVGSGVWTELKRRVCPRSRYQDRSRSFLRLTGSAQTLYVSKTGAGTAIKGSFNGSWIGNE